MKGKKMVTYMLWETEIVWDMALSKHEKVASLKFSNYSKDILLDITVLCYKVIKKFVKLRKNRVF